ncbi:transposase [Streptomyces sp. NBRC 110611]|nr:transposase [Streptomyces sp. NBRC 110611]
MPRPPDEAWETISCGNGAKGPRNYHWAALELPTVAEFDYQGETPVRRRWALARRSISKPEEIAYFLAYAPRETTVADLVRIAGMRWQIEECFQAAKNECGLDQYEVRRYPGWYRHIILAMLAHAYLAVMAADAAAKGGAETLQRPGSAHRGGSPPAPGASPRPEPPRLPVASRTRSELVALAPQTPGRLSPLPLPATTPHVGGAVQPDSS